MFSKKIKCKGHYAFVNDDNDSETELMFGGDTPIAAMSSTRRTVRLSLCTVFAAAILLILTVVSSWAVFIQNLVYHQQQSLSKMPPASSPEAFGLSKPSNCVNAPIRREWRSLEDAQKLEYIDAVACLANRPSKIHAEGSLYDDFPWVHKQMSSKTHASAPFLPWHRLYVHAYESVLRTECGFKGVLPYWDWSLDWDAFESSPVWDTTFGLGGDGDAEGSESVGNGRCVTEGPFSDIKLRYFDGEYEPHCLSRSFPQLYELRELGKLVQPSEMDFVMHETTYADFEENLEKRAHHFLSHSVRGDLSKFTGPNDPIFFLHHVNIDRLWWQWQQSDSTTRLYAYNGKADNVTTADANLADILDLAGLAPMTSVAFVMETEGLLFCYRY